MQISIIIPTYNEARNIGRVLTGIQEVIALSDTDTWSIIVVDSHSPDGTARIVKAAQSGSKNIHLIEEPIKGGIARAYLAGIRYAKYTLNSDAFIEFDGDGQHDPQALRALADALNGGADCVVGSRYIPGGSIPAEWKSYRKILSCAGSLYTRLLLELPVRDATSGLKATSLRSRATEHLPLTEEQLLSTSYAYKLQFLHSIAAEGGTIVEVPIAFRMRDFDVSKSSWEDIIESLKVTGILRLRTLSKWRFLRVMSIGALGFLLQTIFFEVVGVYLRIIPPNEAVLLGAEIAILSNFFLNERFSFGDRPATSLKKKLLKFHLVSLTSVLAQFVAVSIAEHFFSTSSAALQVCYLLGVGCGLIANYLGYFFWVW
jgi:dolichol-phosphate mannosyltransferase